MKKKIYRILKSFGQTTYKYKIKKNMLNLINISECEKKWDWQCEYYIWNYHQQKLWNALKMWEKWKRL